MRLIEETKRKNYKVYVVGMGKGYGRWIEGSLTNNMEEADVVVLTGGEDISPNIYKEPIGKNTYVYGVGRGENSVSSRDAMEIEEYNRAVELGKTLWGTCRGLQLICALNSGKLIQDLDHPGTHKIHFYDDDYSCVTNSLHHQMCYPYLLPKEDYHILATSYGLSTYYSGGRGEAMKMPDRTSDNVIKEPEMLYFPKTKSLGIQGHPEMTSSESDLVKVCHTFLNLTVEGYIDQALALNIPVKDLIKRAWNFSFTKEENELYKQLVEREVRQTELVEE